jgi:hypothetical protein
VVQFSNDLIHETIKAIEKELLSEEDIHLSIAKDFSGFSKKQLIAKKVRDFLEDLNEEDVKEIRKLDVAIALAMEDHRLSVDVPDYNVFNVFTGGSSLTSIIEEVKYLENIRDPRYLLFHKSRLNLESMIVERSLLKYSVSAAARRLVYDVAFLLSTTPLPLDIPAQSSSSSSSFSSGSSLSTLTTNTVSTTEGANRLSNLFKVVYRADK